MKMGWTGGITYSFEETIKLGQQFASFVQQGDVYALNGELASGKTTFIKGVLLGLEYNKPVTSPTYTLVNEYSAKYSIIHIDCFREDDLNRWIGIGMNDYLNDDNILFIEWADKINSILPSDAIFMKFNHKKINTREIQLIDK